MWHPTLRLAALLALAVLCPIPERARISVRGATARDWDPRSLDPGALIAPDS